MGRIISIDTYHDNMANAALVVVASMMGKRMGRRVSEGGEKVDGWGED